MQLTIVYPKPAQPAPGKRRAGFCSRPPDEHRCTGFRNARRAPDGSRVRCNNWRAQGSIYCAYHLRRREIKSQRRVRGTYARSHYKQRYGAAYAVYLSQSLTKRLEELADRTPLELLGLEDELALAKATVEDSAQFYDMALLAAEQADTPEKKQVALGATLTAGQLLRAVVLEVGEIAGKAAGAMLTAKQFVGVQNIPLLVGQVVEAMHEEFGEENAERVERVAARIADMRLPSAPQGTLSTPDQDVAAMDATVPKEEAA